MFACIFVFSHQFYGVMCGVYTILSFIWLLMLAFQWRDLLRIQFWIGGVMLLGIHFYCFVYSTRKLLFIISNIIIFGFHVNVFEWGPSWNPQGLWQWPLKWLPIVEWKYKSNNLWNQSWVDKLGSEKVWLIETKQESWHNAFTTPLLASTNRLF